MIGPRVLGSLAPHVIGIGLVLPGCDVSLMCLDLCLTLSGMREVLESRPRNACRPLPGFSGPHEKQLACCPGMKHAVVRALVVLVLGSGLLCACTTLGPNPATTGVSAIPAGRPSIDAQ